MIQSITISDLTLSDSSGKFLLHDNRGFDVSDLRIDIQNLGNMDGARLGNYFEGKRTFTIEGQINASSEADLETQRRLMQGALSIDEGLKTMTVVTRGGLTVTIDVILTSLQLDHDKGENTWGEFQIQLVAPNFYFDGNVLNSETLTINAGEGGAIPAEIPFSFGSGGSGNVTATNAGNGKARPLIKIYGPIQDPTVQNATTEKSISVTYTLNSAEDFIEIDTRNQTVKLNGVSDIISNVTGDLEDFYLLPGDNVLKLVAVAFTEAEATVEWYDSYIGL